MSSKLLKQQLNSVLRRTIDKQDDKKQTSKSRRRQSRGKRKGTQQSAEEKQTQVLASNLKYFAKTTTTSGKAEDLVTQVGGWEAVTARRCHCRRLHPLHLALPPCLQLLTKQGFQPRPRKQAEQQQQRQQQADDSDDDLAEFADLL